MALPALVAVDSLRIALGQKEILLAQAVSRADSLLGLGPDIVVRSATPADLTPEAWAIRALPIIIGGAMAILGGILAQAYRAHVDESRARVRLVTRIRYALIVVSTSSLATTKKGMALPINPEVMNGILVEWARYDRVADDAGLLGDPSLEAEIDALLSHGRRVAEKVIEDESRFRATLQELGRTTPTGRNIDPAVVTDIHSHRKNLLGLIEGLGPRSLALLSRLDKMWPPPTVGRETHDMPIVIDE